MDATNQPKDEQRCSPLMTTMILEPYTDAEKHSAASTTNVVMYAGIGFACLLVLVFIVFIVWKVVIPWHRARKGSIAAPSPIQRV